MPRCSVLHLLQIYIITNDLLFAQTEEAKHEANKNTGSGESFGDKASRVGNVASNKVKSQLLRI